MQEAMLHAAQKDELVQGLVERLERTFATLDQDEALARVARYLRALDEPTLRVMAYREGLFEPETEPLKPGDPEC